MLKRILRTELMQYVIIIFKLCDVDLNLNILPTIKTIKASQLHDHLCSIYNLVFSSLDNLLKSTKKKNNNLIHSHIHTSIAPQIKRIASISKTKKQKACFNFQFNLNKGIEFSLCIVHFGIRDSNTVHNCIETLKM